jgi:hypothetical protein
MTPWHALVFLIFWGAIVAAGYHLGKYKGHIAAGIVLTAVLGLLGLLIVALIPQTDAAKIAAAQRNMAIQQEAARRAGYSYPPQPPPGQWTPPPSDQWTPPSWDQWSQPPGGQWQGPHDQQGI